MKFDARAMLIAAVTALSLAWILTGNTAAETAAPDEPVLAEPAETNPSAEPEDAHPEVPDKAVPFPPVTLSKIKPERKTKQTSIHPPVPFLNEDGDPVFEAGGALSLMKTCGQCHDTDYIAKHNYHATAGLYEMTEPGETNSGRPFDVSPGMFGRWSPLTYRVLTPEGVDKLDMGTADWVRVMGPRHVGGGPAVWSRKLDFKLDELRPGEGVYAETHALDPETGEAVLWDWKESGTVELNCLLCHVPEPNNVERIKEIKDGRFRWASTATLVGSGIVERNGDELAWNKGAFDEVGAAAKNMLSISDPHSGNCRLCHGRACSCNDPVVFENSLDNWSTETTGEIFSPERMLSSGMNLKGKESLHRPWDVHAERLFKCSDCHYSMNNPEYNEKESAENRPRHLKFDARKLDYDQYLQRPDHNLAKGHNAQGTVARDLAGSMRDCRECHDANATHDFLVYKRLHFEKLSCQTCHVQRMHAPARMATDWTLLGPDREPLVQHRGVNGEINDPSSLIDGYRPALFLHKEEKDAYRVGPHNVIASWFWFDSATDMPVRKIDLEKAFFDERGNYRDSILAALDVNGDGTLSEGELKLDTADKVEATKSALEAAGVNNPAIGSELQPYTLSHSVASRGFAIKDCGECHRKGSRMEDAVLISGYVPGGIYPEPVGDSNVIMDGAFEMREGGELMWKPTIDPDRLYVHGTDRLNILDILGILAVLGAFIGATGHGGLRYLASRKRDKGE